MVICLVMVGESRRGPLPRRGTTVAPDERQIKNLWRIKDYEEITISSITDGYGSGDLGIFGRELSSITE